MAEEASASETLAPNPLQPQTTNEATIESDALAGGGGTESTCNNTEISPAPADVDRDKSLEFADELIDRGSKAVKDGDFAEATDCFSNALEIRVAHYGELGVQCVDAYYKYGCALLYKAQEEADPLGSVPKKDGEGSSKDGSVKNPVNGESSTTSISSTAGKDESSNHQGAPDDVSSGKDQEEDGEESSDDEDLAEADEDESDLDLAWKMLDIARAIVEKESVDTMEKVDILSALAEVALEREDTESSLNDYLKALSILERLAEPDSRHLAELNFRVCLCLEMDSKAEEALPYCEKAITVCKSRVQRLTDETKTSASPELDQNGPQSSTVSRTDNVTTDKGAEIEQLSGLAIELEKKLEDLQQMVVNPPSSILSEIMGIVTANAKAIEKKTSEAVANGKAKAPMNETITWGFGSASVTTATANGVTTGGGEITHLGVVGRGVKRVNMSTVTTESSPLKKPELDVAQDKGDGNAS